VISVLEKLDLVKTRYFLIAPVFKDKSITANNIYILEDIFKRQLRLDDESPIFNTNIRLVYSNLKI